MARRIEPRERVTQKSISIKQRQREFLDWAEMHPDKCENFNLNDLVQVELDFRIARTERRDLLSNDDERKQ